MENILSKAFIAVTIVGILDAVFTATEYITRNTKACTINSYFSCGSVISSGHTSIFGIPFYVAGLIWFPLLLILGLVLTRRGSYPLRADVLLPLLMIGNIFTVYLWYLELVVINAICPLCLSLYIVNYVLTAFVIISAL